MSTRYVWNKYDIEEITNDEWIDKGSASGNIPSTSGGAVLPTKEYLYFSELDEPPVYGASIPLSRYYGQTISATKDKYLAFYQRGTAYIADDARICRVLENSSIIIDDTGDYYKFSGEVPLLEMRLNHTETQTKGDFLSAVSGPSQSTYPDDGVKGSYWYTYQGDDNIDPASVSIPSTINGGTAIKITVTPGTGKIYGGTVSYIYQVSLAGGAWTTIATTTATSRSYTVPYGTASIQVRVQAKDNLGFTSTTYVTSSSVTVINNQPPTAPGSIDVTNVVAGQQATITLTAATDPDGTIASYIYERSVDGSAWTQIANVNSLTQTDTISADWGTVAYRAKAVDNDGDSGPYVTSSTTVVNSGWVIISGPAADMGSQPKPFDFVFSVSVTGQASVDSINAVVLLDGETIYTGTPNSDVEVTIPIDTRLLAAGEHTVEVQATKESYLEANGSYTFDVPAITLPDGGMAEMLQNPEGDVVFPYTLARLVIGKGGKDLNELLGDNVKIQAGNYVGTGTFGADNPNSLTFGFEPKIVFLVSVGQRNIATPYVWGSPSFTILESSASFGSGSGTLTMRSDPVSINGRIMSWYSDTAARRQFNEAGVSYYWAAIGQ